MVSHILTFSRTVTEYLDAYLPAFYTVVSHGHVTNCLKRAIQFCELGGVPNKLSKVLRCLLFAKGYDKQI